MSLDPVDAAAPDWRHQLPALVARAVTLREPAQSDVDALVEVLASCDAARFGLDGAAERLTVGRLVARWGADRSSGCAATFAIAFNAEVVGLVQVRQLDPRFESADWDMAISAAQRGTGVFLDAARLAISFVFGTLGTHRLEARVPAQSGRAMGAMRKLGAVQEGLLRRSIRHGDQYFDQALWSILNEDWWHRQTADPRVH